MSKRISLKNVIIGALQDVKLTKKQSTEIAKKIIANVEDSLLTTENEVIIGKLGKLVLRSYPEGTRFSPILNKEVTRKAYKCVRFKTFTGAKVR